MSIAPRVYAYRIPRSRIEHWVSVGYCPRTCAGDLLAGFAKAHGLDADDAESSTDEDGCMIFTWTVVRVSDIVNQE